MTQLEPKQNQYLKGFLLTLGVYVCYLLLNVFNEKMHKYPYRRKDGSGSDYFSQDASLNCFTSLFCTIIGFTYNRVFPPKQRTNLPARMIVKQSILMLISGWCTNKAMGYLPFVVVSMAKSCSIMGVVIVGVFFTRVKNQKNKMTPSKIIVAILIVSGTLLFQSTGNKTIEESIPINQVIGFSLLLFSVISDGLIPDYQARMKETHNPTMMEHYEHCHRYLFLIVFSISTLNGGLLKTFYFWYIHHDVFLHCLCYVVCGSLGHIFIFGLISSFSQLVTPLVLALRKIISVIISVLWFRHDLNIYQYLGVLLVFSGAIYEATDKPRAVQREKKQEGKSM